MFLLFLPYSLTIIACHQEETFPEHSTQVLSIEVIVFSSLCILVQSEIATGNGVERVGINHRTEILVCCL